jgi:hypothetical protein
MLINILILTLIAVNVLIGIFLYDFYQERKSSKPVEEEVVQEESPEEKQTDTSKSETTDQSNVEEEMVETSNTPAFFAITDEEIQQAIDEGVNTNGYQKPFELYKHKTNSAGTLGDLSQSAYINTPYHLVAGYASTEFFKNDYVINVEEAKSKLDYNTISFSLNFSRDTALLFAAKLRQNGKIINPTSVINDDISGYYKILYFNARDINFNEPAFLTVFDKGNEEAENEEYIIYFDQFR